MKRRKGQSVGGAPTRYVPTRASNKNSSSQAELDCTLWGPVHPEISSGIEDIEKMSHTAACGDLELRVMHEGLNVTGENDPAVQDDKILLQSLLDGLNGLDHGTRARRIRLFRMASCDLGIWSQSFESKLVALEDTADHEDVIAEELPSQDVLTAELSATGI